MKNFIIPLVLIVSFSLVLAHTEDAQLSVEIQKGGELVKKFQRGEVNCQSLTDEDFHSIGELVMEQMIGGSDHLRMNEIMEQMHGQEAEELMHINMGKRYLGCDGSTGGIMMNQMMPRNLNMPMMQGMWNWAGWNFTSPFFAILGIIFMLSMVSLPILLLILFVLLIVYLIKKIRVSTKND